MTAALRRSDLSFEPDAPKPQRPTLTLVPAPAAKPALLPATNIHPAVFAIPLAAAAWFLVVAWAAFGVGETSLVLAVATVFCLMFFGLFVGGAAFGRDMTPERAHSRSFRAFLKGEVDIATGLISGREALVQIAAMPLAITLAATALALIAVGVPTLPVALPIVVTCIALIATGF